MSKNKFNIDFEFTKAIKYFLFWLKKFVTLWQKSHDRYTYIILLLAYVTIFDDFHTNFL